MTRRLIEATPIALPRRPLRHFLLGVDYRWESNNSPFSSPPESQTKKTLGHGGSGPKRRAAAELVLDGSDRSFCHPPTNGSNASRRWRYNRHGEYGYSFFATFGKGGGGCYGRKYSCLESQQPHYYSGR